MTATMTFAGLEVHAGSTHAAAIDVLTGELRRARFGLGSKPGDRVAAGAAAAVYACDKTACAASARTGRHDG